MLKSKIHHCRVTDRKLMYVGSIFIDEDLMKKANIAKYEQVVVINVTNGERWETYAMPEKKGSGIISVNGGGAKLCKKNDLLIILAYEITTKTKVNPKQIIVDKKNKFKEYL